MKLEAWNTLILESSKGASLAEWLTAMLDLETMRRIAIDKGLTAKGFRVEKASVQRLAPLLAKEAAKNVGLREELARALKDVCEGSSAEATPPSSPSPDPGLAERKALELRLRKALKKSQREALSAKKARESREKSLAKLSAQARVEAELRREVQALTKDCEATQKRLAEMEASRSAGDRKSDEELERERAQLMERIQELEEFDRAHRISEAEHLSRIRELESVVQELDALLPRGKRERLKQFQRSQVEQRSAPGLIPVYSRDFLDALDRISEADQHRIHTALAQIVLGGLNQPGHRVKSLKGRGELLSLRAGIHYRVYFTRTGDKIHLHHVGTREEQDTFLRKWKS